MASYPLFLSLSFQLRLLILKLFLIKQETIRGEIELPAEWVPILGTKIPSIWLKERRKKKKREKKISSGKEGRFCVNCAEISVPKLIPFAWGAEPTASSCICLPLLPYLVWGWCHLGGGQPHTQQLESTQHFICMPALRPS